MQFIASFFPAYVNARILKQIKKANFNIFATILEEKKYYKFKNKNSRKKQTCGFSS